eukprot:TRINITY_DN17466_c0_g1_i1.p1 TRINITY_DN17466_c0_g1~~TRINITY_DN17466_c0_g1_i1.p1  ORF type:complete len:455 (-),score=54.16 TRINITY_DN17466_c0_g1_i1:83-1447(-)
MAKRDRQDQVDEATKRLRSLRKDLDLNGRIELLYRWLGEHKCRIAEYLEITADASGFGMSVRVRAESGQAKLEPPSDEGPFLAQIPISAVLTDTHAHSVLREANVRGIIFGQQSLLVFLSLVKSQRLCCSRFGGYVGSLPPIKETAVLTDAILDQLGVMKGSELRQKVMEREKSLIKMLREHNNCQTEAIWEISEEEWQWAALMFSSRTFSASLSQDAHAPVMLPLIDCFNHSSESPINVARFVAGVECGEEGSEMLEPDRSEAMQPDIVLSFMADVDLEPGEEVFNNYGTKSNLELLVDYGFAIETNPLNESIELFLHLKCNIASLRSELTDLLGQKGVVEEAMGHSASMDSKVVLGPFRMLISRNSEERLSIPETLLKTARLLSEYSESGSVSVKEILLDAIGTEIAILDKVLSRCRSCEAEGIASQVANYVISQMSLLKTAQTEVCVREVF